MIKDFLRSLLPDFWTMLYPYSKSGDKALNRLLDSHTFEIIDRYTAKLGGYEVWVENHPYASFTPRIKGKTEEVRPSRMTIIKARKLLEITPGFRENFNDFEDVQ